ncbi:hypothetical protein G0W18_09830, partial [Staphylococcus aureus]|nr:hypothetical protein [Staphylococcus aureus]
STRVRSSAASDVYKRQKQFLPQHEEQLERTEELLAIAKDKQWQRQVETNSRVKERLEQIIGSLTG